MNGHVDSRCCKQRFLKSITDHPQTTAGVGAFMVLSGTAAICICIKAVRKALAAALYMLVAVTMLASVSWFGQSFWMEHVTKGLPLSLPLDALTNLTNASASAIGSSISSSVS